MSKSYTPPDRSTYDPGWNDPPPNVSSMPVAAATGKTRLNLNKRVAFPMQGSAANPSSSSSSNVKTTAEGLPLPFSTAKYQPPPTTLVPEASKSPSVLPPPPSAPILDASINSSESVSRPAVQELSIDLTAAREYCNSVFVRLIDSMNANDVAAKSSEIRKRLDVLNEMWLENKFDEATQTDIYKLAKALDSNDIALAKEQHQILVTHHIHVSTQWATALRQIIFSLAPDDASECDKSDMPAVLPDNELNVVHLLNVSSSPTVIDANPSFNLLSQPNVITNQPAAMDQPNLVQDEQQSEKPVEPNQPPKSKSRFGPILHL